MKAHHMGLSLSTVVVALAWFQTADAQPIEAPLPPAQPVEGQPPPPPPPGYTAPSKADWKAADLDPAEYDLAVSHQVSLEDWKEMDRSRHTHQSAGWACFGIGLLIPAIGITVKYAVPLDWTKTPAMESYIMFGVASLASLVTGIILVATAPGPEEAYAKSFGSQSATSLHLVPSPGGIGLGFSF